MGYHLAVTGALLSLILAGEAKTSPLFMLNSDQASLPAKHFNHHKLYSEGAAGEGAWVLRGIDEAQKRAPKNDDWWVGVKAVPLESPVGFELSLWGKTLFKPERETSFCSGATYAALMLGLQKKFPTDPGLTDEGYESLRQTEADGSRRHDQIGFWGVWNGSGAGLHWALVDLTGAGTPLSPSDLRPGDFVQIYWSPTRGHSTIFLGWHQSEDGSRFMRIWSSQEGTSGMGDWNVPVKRISRLVGVRLSSGIRVLSAPAGTFPYAGPAGDKVPDSGWPALPK